MRSGELQDESQCTGKSTTGKRWSAVLPGSGAPGGLATPGVGKYHPGLNNARFPPMFSGSSVALVTPMTADGTVDFACLERLVDFHIESGTDFLVIAGTTGESATLTKPEHIEVIRVAAERAAGRIPVVAGTGSNATSEAIELTEAAE